MPPRTCRRASARTPRRGALPPALRDPRARDPESGAAARRGGWWRCCGGRWRRPWPALVPPREGASGARGAVTLPGLVRVLVLVLVLGFELVLVLVVELVRVDVRVRGRARGPRPEARGPQFPGGLRPEARGPELQARA